MANRFSIEAVFKAIDQITAPVSKIQNRVGKLSRKMTRGFKNVNRAIDGMIRKFRSAGVSVIKFGSVALAAMTTAFVITTQKVATAADSLAKRARRLEFPIEALQEWGFVAEQSGVKVSTLDKSINIFVKRMGEARAGFGPMITGLKRMNPALLKQLNRTKDVSKAFDIYIKAIRDTTGAADQAALANQAFGRSGVEIVSIAKNSAAAITALRKEMRLNGVVTMEQAANAERFNDAINTLRLSVTGVLRSAILPLLPKFTEWALRLREIVLANRKLIMTRIDLVIDKISKGVKLFISRLKELHAEHDILTTIGNVLKGIGKAILFLSKHIKTITNLTKAVVLLVVAFKTLSAILTVINVLSAMNPIGLLIIAITASITVITLFILNIKKIANWFERMPFLIKAVIGALAIMGGPLTTIAFAATLIIAKWKPLKAFFINLWDTIKKSFNSMINFITPGIEKITGFLKKAWEIDKNITSGVRGFLGMAPEGGARTQMISPQERISRTIEQSNSEATVTIRDETKRAEVSSGNLGNNIRLMPSGAF